MLRNFEKVVCNELTTENPDELQRICDEVKAQVEEKIGCKLGVYTVHSYKSKVVTRANYFIKVHVGGAEYVHLCVYEMLPCDGGKLELTDIQLNKTLTDPIEYD